MLIAEIYQSIQGEGRRAGRASVFVRASGCNLRCHFCDTQYTSWSPEGQDLAVDDVLARVDEWDCEEIVLTGGEPMLFAELIPLAKELKARGRQITIETAGTLYLPVVCDLMSISPKLSNSTPPAERDARWSRRHERARHRPEIVARLTAEYDYQLKFVVDEPADCDEVAEYLAAFDSIDTAKVMLMPQGTDAAALAARTEWVVARCEAEGWTYCPRLQIEWFGPVRGT